MTTWILDKSAHVRLVAGATPQPASTSPTSPSAISANLNGCIQHGQLPTTTANKRHCAPIKSFAHPATSLTGFATFSAT